MNNDIFQSWQQWTSIAFRGTSGLYPLPYTSNTYIVIKDRWTIYTSTTLWWNPQSINRRVFGRPNSQGTTSATRPPWSQQRWGDVRIVLSGGSNFGGMYQWYTNWIPTQDSMFSGFDSRYCGYRSAYTWSVKTGKLSTDHCPAKNTGLTQLSHNIASTGEWR